jgi:hypothetical protein
VIDSGLTALLLIGIFWFWWDSRGVAEQAIHVAKQRCEHTGVVLLNDTVAWKKIRFKRNRQGRMSIQRTYFFEFASDMQRRYGGEITMLGHQLEQVRMEPYRVK